MSVVVLVAVVMHNHLCNDQHDQMIVQQHEKHPLVQLLPAPNLAQIVAIVIALTVLVQNVLEAAEIVMEHVLLLLQKSQKYRKENHPHLLVHLLFDKSAKKKIIIVEGKDIVILVAIAIFLTLKSFRNAKSLDENGLLAARRPPLLLLLDHHLQHVMLLLHQHLCLVDEHDLVAQPATLSLSNQFLKKSSLNQSLRHPRWLRAVKIW